VSEEHHDEPASQDRINARELIEDDLTQLQKERRRHFAPALILAVLALGGFFLIRGARPDLLNQPPWQLAVQIGLWGLCLVVFPAIGLGLLFPNRSTRVALAIGGVALTIAATLGWPFGLVPNHGLHFGGCMVWLLTFGFVLVTLGLFSGAFVQRRANTAIYWVAAGVALAALNTVTWHCPMTGAEHVMASHLGGAIAVLVFACAAGFIAHRRRSA
jgi:hypothetical protein